MAKWPFAVAGVSIVMLLGVGLFIWRPWEPPKKTELAEAPVVKTYSEPKELSDADYVDDAQVYDPVEAVKGWHDVTAQTDLSKVDTDMGYLSMSETTTEHRDALQDAAGAPSAPIDSGNVNYNDWSKENVRVDENGVEHSYFLRHRWLDFARFNAAISPKGEAMDIVFEGVAYNDTQRDCGAESLPPIFVDGKPVPASVGEVPIKNTKAASFRYSFRMPADEFDLTVYGYTAHVKVKPVAKGSEVSLDSEWRQVDYPALTQEFVDDLAEHISVDVGKMRALSSSGSELPPGVVV